MPYTSDGWMSQSEWYDREASRDAYERDVLDRERFTTGDPMPEPAPQPPVQGPDEYTVCEWCRRDRPGHEVVTVRGLWGQPYAMCAGCRKRTGAKPIDDDQEEAA